MSLLRVPLVLLVCLLAASASAQAPSFVAFESGPVRPMALSPDGKRLYVVNTPDNRLEIFRVTDTGLAHANSVPVGMEPVAVAARSDSEIWVVNHLSDSVSIVHDDRTVLGGRVARTLLVGDEPRDIVFAGPNRSRAFITTAHRGQHRTHPSLAGVPGAGDPQLTTEGVPRADVWVFDADALGSAVGGVPLEIVELFGDTPRALAVTPDGSTVYAAVFHSGNQTAVVNEGSVCDGFGSTPCDGDGITSPGGMPNGQVPGGLPGPSANHEGVQAPETGLVVQYDETAGEWQDADGDNWSNGIRFHLPDYDVFAIDASTLTKTADFAHVGTILFNMAVNPVSGKVYVSNTDAQNLTRFEGPGDLGGSTVRGNLAHSRITVLDGLDVQPRHLNKHIDYDVFPPPAGVKDHSLATPLEIAVSSDGSTLYVAAFGSGKVGVYDTAALESDSFDPTAVSANHIDVSGGGPSGVVLNEARGHMYVATRFDNGVSTVDLATGEEVHHLPLHNPEPQSVVDGRFMLYDAVRTSSNGESSCSSCHVFGDFDSLAWDLGDPDADVGTNPMPINLESVIPFLGNADEQNGDAALDEFHPMKGPMTTQTLRGLANSGAMHWRGDRADGFFGTDQTFDGGSNDGDEELSFMNFIVAFEGLVGLAPPAGYTTAAEDPQLQADMQKFTDFMLQVQLPPNPVRALDNSLNAAQQAGRDFFFGDHGGNDCSDGACVSIPSLGIEGEGVTGFSCNGCHVLDPAQGFFGTGTFSSFENETQIFKIPHLRNLYQKVGMFGMPDVDFNNGGDNQHKGDQVRGTGFLHDGSTDTLFRFFQATVFNNNEVLGVDLNAGFDGGDPQRRDVEQFMLAFPSDLAPVVGQQVTLSTETLADPQTLGRLSLLEDRAGATFVSKELGGTTTECDLVAKAEVDGMPRGWLYDPGSGTYEPDSTADPFATRGDLEQLAASGSAVTFTCVPPGSGVRVALDRDEDGYLDYDELFVASTDPANPGSVPGACSDGIDNDGDGLVDLADPGCKDASSNIENPACNDGVDNDRDGDVDLADSHCTDPFLNRERVRSCGLLGLEVLPVLGLVALRRQRRRAAARRA